MVGPLSSVPLVTIAMFSLPTIAPSAAALSDSAALPPPQAVATVTPAIRERITDLEKTFMN